MSEPKPLGEIVSRAGIDLKLIFNRTDVAGNKLTLKGEELYLSLWSEHRIRHIGYIRRHKDGKLMYCKKESPENIFRQFNAWGLHYHIVENVDYLMILSGGKAYKILAEKAREVGKFLHFKKEGFELQIFVPLEEWWVGNV